MVYYYYYYLFRSVKTVKNSGNGVILTKIFLNQSPLTSSACPQMHGGPVAIPQDAPFVPVPYHRSILAQLLQLHAAGYDRAAGLL